MGYTLGFLLFGIIGLEIVSCVLWNVRPLVKVRLRPPRHQLPIAQHSNHVYHRAHSFGQRPQHNNRMPLHHDTPVFTYRPPNVGGPGPGPGYKMKHAHQPLQHSSNNQNRFRGPPVPPVPPYHHFHQNEMLTDTKHKLIKFESPNSNLLENSGYTTSMSLDESQQHGYLSPKYKGWKPISKPKFEESKGDEYTYTYTPTTEKYEDPNERHHKLMLTTLFRDNVKNIKPPGHVKLKSEYSENRGVAIPLPTELGGSSITLPASIFLERPQQTNFNNNIYSPAISPSQSEEKPIIRKPFPRFHQKLKADDKLNQSFNIGNGNKEDGGGQELPQLLSKFKNMRPPRVRPTTPPQSSSYDNEPENDGIGPTNLPKLISPFPTKVPETSSQAPMTFKEKYNKVRTRIRTRVRQPDGQGQQQQQGQGHVNTEDLRQVFSRSRPDPGPLETSINPKEAFRDPQRQQEHNSLLYTPSGFSKNITSSFSQSSFLPKESHVSHHPDRNRGEYAWNKNRNQGVPSLPQVSGNKISDEPSGVGGSNPGLGDKPSSGEKKRKPNSEGTRPESVGPPFVYTDNPVYSEEFYLPPGFLQNPSLSGHKPVSFMTMPGSQPQVIHHHTGHNGHPPHQSPHQLYPINFVGSKHKSKHHQPIQPQQHNDGTSPNSNYVQNNRPQHFLFMNIQNGQLQPTGSNPNHEAPPLFTPQTYDTGVTSQPFSHSTSPFPTGSGGFHHHPKSREPSPAQHYHFHHTAPTAGSSSTTTTTRNPYSPYPSSSSDSRFPSHYINHPTHHIDHHHHPPNRIQQQMGKPTRNPDITQTYSHHPSNNNLDAYASNEYKQIPMEFMNHLRPILLDEDGQAQFGSQTAPSRQKEYFSSELYPPNEYFDNFFKSYEIPYKEEKGKSSPLAGPSAGTGTGSTGGNNRYLAQPSGDRIVRVPYEDSYKSSSNPQVQILELNSEQQNKTLSSSTTPRWSPPKHAIVSIAPIHEYTFESSTVSPIQDIELFHQKSQGQRSWSKLKDTHNDRVGISSTELYLSPTSKYKRLIGQGTLQQSENQKVEIQKTTPRPIFSSFSSVKKTEESTVTQIQSIENLKPTPSMVTKLPPASTEVQPVTVRNYRIRVTTTEKSPVVEVTGDNKDLEQSESTTQSQSLSGTQSQSLSGTRPLRRRKVGMHGHRFFTSARVNEVEDDKLSDPPVTTHRPRRLILSTSTGATLERPDDSSESFEVSGGKRLKSRRRFFNRRMNVHANRAGMIGLRATTPSAADVSDAVTYGESQWFRIKDLVPDDVTESGESGKVVSSSSTEKLNSNPIDESTSKFSSRALSTTPDVKLEILEPLEMSSEKLTPAQSENSSGRNFYEAAESVAAGAAVSSENVDGVSDVGDDKEESQDSIVRENSNGTDVMSL